MNKHFLPLVSLLALGTLSFAGGNIAPIEEPAAQAPVAAPSLIDEGSFYLGLGFSGLKLSNDLTNEAFKANGLMLQAGYQYNRYIALEGRYTLSVGAVDYTHGNTINPDYPDYPTDFTNLAIYLKPIYPIGSFSLYALLGYGEVALTNIPIGDVDRAEARFQWGIGASYSFTETISLFADYVQMYKGTGFDYRAMDADIKADVWTLGVSYRF